MEMAVLAYVLTAHVCPSLKGESCKDVIHYIGSQYVCEERKRVLLDLIPGTRAEPYGWPKGTTFSINLACEIVRGRMRA